jgi:hypothetical protein
MAAKRNHEPQDALALGARGIAVSTSGQLSYSLVVDGQPIILETGALARRGGFRCQGRSGEIRGAAGHPERQFEAASLARGRFRWCTQSDGDTKMT